MTILPKPIPCGRQTPFPWDPRIHWLNDEIIEAIRLHNEHAHPEKRSTVFHHALAAGETITGLIIAAALVYPDKKRFKEKAFTAGASRDIIRKCEKCGLELGDFSDLCLTAMQGISGELGL